MWQSLVTGGSVELASNQLFKIKIAKIHLLERREEKDKNLHDAHLFGRTSESLLGWEPKFKKKIKISFPLDIFCTSMYKSHFAEK